MQKIVGYMLILMGAGLVIMTVLATFGVLGSGADIGLQAATVWDVLLELVKKTPWTAAVGMLMLYAGLKMINVQLPFSTLSRRLQPHR